MIQTVDSSEDQTGYDSKYAAKRAFSSGKSVLAAAIRRKVVWSRTGEKGGGLFGEKREEMNELSHLRVNKGYVA